MEDFDVLSAKDFFLLSTLLRIIKQGIGSSICLALAVINLEVLTRKFLNLANLSGAQTLCVHEPAKIVVISKYKHLMLRPF